MKKFLPRTVNNTQGFTLVELMVVVAIIAILSVIGITIFTGVQKNARDARRRADVDQISKAYEANISKQAPYYPILQATWFAGGSIPHDPSTNAAYDYVGTNGEAGTAGAAGYTVCARLTEGSATACTATSTSCYCISNQQ